MFWVLKNIGGVVCHDFLDVLSFLPRVIWLLFEQGHLVGQFYQFSTLGQGDHFLRLKTCEVFFGFMELGSENTVVYRWIQLDSRFDGGVTVHGGSMVEIGEKGVLIGPDMLARLSAQKSLLSSRQIQMPQLFQRQIQKVSLSLNQLVSLERFAFKDNFWGLVREACHFEGLDQLRDLRGCLAALSGTRHAGFVEGQQWMLGVFVLLAFPLAVDQHFSGATHHLWHINPEIWLRSYFSIVQNRGIQIVGVCHDRVVSQMVAVNHRVLIQILVIDWIIQMGYQILGVSVLCLALRPFLTLGHCAEQEYVLFVDLILML